MKKKLIFITSIIVLSAFITACADQQSSSAEAPAENLEAEIIEEAADEEAAIQEAAAEEQTADETEAETDAEESAKVTVYISPDALGTALEEAFEADHGDVIDIVGGPWCRKLKSEQEAGQIQADVIYGAEPIFFRELMEADALLAYTSPETANHVATYQFDNGYFSAADLRYLGIIYNTTLVDEADLPTTFEEINDPQWAKLTTVSDATQCATAFAIVAALVQPDMDMSFYENAKANDALLSDRAGKIGETVASGEAALGVGPHDPVVRLQNKAKKEGVESPVNITWSTDGAYVIQRPVAIIDKTDRPESVTETAKAFVDFILSKQGQTIIAKKGGFVPMNAEVESSALIPADLPLLTIDWDWAAENSEAITTSFQEIMFNN